MLDPTKVDDIQVGFTVKIEKQHTIGEFVTGIVAVIVSKANHPQGVFVKLVNDLRGRVKSILDTNVAGPKTSSSTSYVVEAESSKIEYKQHFIYYHNENISPEKKWVVEHSIYKTIAAFANGEGGKLIIGIHDNGTIFGLDSDYKELKKLKENGNSIYKPDRDGMELKIKTDCNHYFPKQFRYALELITKITFPKIHGKEICEISVLPSYEFPLILYDKNSSPAKLGPLFYVRKGNSSENYEATDFLEYWVSRIKSFV